MAKKDGPCCHCGATSTPLWRNGPPTKPVLCNACGSRWRTRGTLKFYTPIHSRGFGPGGLYGKYSHGHELPSRRKLKNINTVSENRDVAEVGGAGPKQEPLEMVFADDGSIRSSSGSRISFSENRIKLGSINENDAQGPMQPSFWDCCIPSRKRTGHKRLGPSLVQKLARDLSDILQKQEQSGLSNSLEEVLIYPKGKDSADFFETSLGSVLIKRPLPSAEEKSEGSSFPMENKNSCSNDAYVESQCSKLSFSSEVKYEEVKKAGEGWETMGDPKEDHAL